jgi:hypothetical protein
MRGKEANMENGKTLASPEGEPAAEPSGQIYEIKVAGCMDVSFWADWFDAMEFSIQLAQGETLLRGRIADQAELYGLLSQLRNQGMTLISVQRVAS